MKKKIPKTLILKVFAQFFIVITAQQYALMLTLALFINQNHDQASMMSMYFFLTDSIAVLAPPEKTSLGHFKIPLITTH